MGRPIVVIGSVNMDLVCRTSHMPKAGETILGRDLVTIPGGKGANQAVAAAKLVDRNTDVHLVARVGSDDFGQRLMSGLVQHHVATRYVTVTEGVSSGCAVILLDKDGENSIVVAPGANAKLTPADVDAAEQLIGSAAVVIFQLEIPLATVRHAIAMCQRLGIYTILDPAPVPEKGLARSFFGVDVFTPNQTEAELLIGQEQTHRVRSKRIFDPKQIGSDFLRRGAKNVVLKLGAKGAMVMTGSGEIEAVKPFKVKVVDMTAAGDAFTGALAVGRAEGMGLVDGVKFANAAGALACAAFGAQPALPGRSEVDKLLNR